MVLSTAADAAVAASGFLRPGQWDMTMQIDRDGKRITDSYVSRKCITKENLEKEEQGTFAPFESGCTSTNKQSGKTIEWSYECVGPTQMKGSGKLTYAKDQYSGTSESFADLTGGKSLRMVHTETKFTAKRVGSCPKQKTSPATKEKKPSAPRKSKEAGPVVAKLGD